MMSSARVSGSEQRYITEGARVNVRTDGRGRLDVRHIVAQCGVLDYCNGSALLGQLHTSAKVLCGVKVQTTKRSDMYSGSESNKGDQTSGLKTASGTGKESSVSLPLFDVSVDTSAIEMQRENIALKHTRNLRRAIEKQVVDQLTAMLADGREQHLVVVPGKVSWKIFGTC